jgi:hypothetical protein
LVGLHPYSFTIGGIALKSAPSGSNILPASERGSSLLAAILIALIASALSSTFLADTLVEARISIMTLESESTMRTALSMLRLAIEELKAGVRNANATSWNIILPGPDGSFASCGRADLNPVRPEDAVRSVPGTLCAACGDDGIIFWPSVGVPIVGQAGLLILQSTTKSQRLIPIPEAHLGSGSQAGFDAADYQAWFKVSDNPEPDGDPKHDHDGIAILRIVVAHRSLPAAKGRAAWQESLNTVVILEAWLRIVGNANLRVMAIRQVPFE